MLNLNLVFAFVSSLVVVNALDASYGQAIDGYTFIGPGACTTGLAQYASTQTPPEHNMVNLRKGSNSIEECIAHCNSLDRCIGVWFDWDNNNGQPSHPDYCDPIADGCKPNMCMIALSAILPNYTGTGACLDSVASGWSSHGYNKDFWAQNAGGCVNNCEITGNAADLYPWGSHQTYREFQCYRRDSPPATYQEACGSPAGTNKIPPLVPNSPAGSPAVYQPRFDGGAGVAQGPVKGDAGNDITGSNQNYNDPSPNPTGASHGGRDPRREPHVSWSGDLDPKSRSLQGTITIRPGLDARNLKSWKLYPTGDGSYANRKDLHFADGSRTGSAGDKAAQYSLALASECGASCTNNSPYSPSCGTNAGCTETQYLVAHDGTKTVVTREKATILAGDSGEFYISRVQNQICDYSTTDYDPANANSKDGTITGSSVTTYLSDPAGGLGGTPTAGTLMNKRTCAGDTSEDHYRTSQYYDANEQITISLPTDGWLTLVLKDFDGSATLGAGSHSYTSAEKVNQATDVAASSTLSWSAGDNPNGKGWTFIYQPNYPDVVIDGPMANGAAGFVVVGTYEAGEDTENVRFVETMDWIVPNVTCTPTTMHCPIPNVWAHIDYTTPSMYPEPAEGSCEQVKTGSSSVSACSDKTDTNDRWYATGSISTTSKPGLSASGDNEEDNGQNFADDTAGKFHNNWAGNCGDATSYFWFEKIACGSTRIFHTDGRSLIEDNIVLSPTWESIRDILAEYYTTKAPLDPNNGGTAGFTFINADYHVAPVLPPKVECSCLAAMDAYASLLSVQSKTPTPGAPVTLDPEVLNTGSSKIVATLRMYHDPTYSLSAEEDSTMPIVVSRFYLEVSTKFTRNRITISDCTASNREQLLNGSNALKPRSGFCDNSTFDTRTEASPAGVTHMDRISMKKFKFHTTTDVFMQCKIRACAAQPCGTCKARQLSSSPDLSPVEGEMFAPPTKIRVSQFDKNALVFQSQQYVDPVATFNAATPTTQQNIVAAKPIQISSAMTLPVTATWATENRGALVQALRATLGLNDNETLTITSINAARRLQAGASQGVKIDFVVGVSDTSRATVASASIGALSSGSALVVKAFASELDRTLVASGQTAIALDANAVKFTPAQTTRTQTQQVNPSGQYNMLSSFGLASQPETSAQASDSKPKEESSSTLVIVLLLAIIGAGVLFILSRKSATKPVEIKETDFTSAVYDDNYASKIADETEMVHG